LFEKAEQATGNLEPYLLQLSNYDAREIKQFQAEMDLSDDVAVRALITGMMQGATSEEIVEKIKIFLTPETTKSHGRSIFYQEAKSCGLNIELMDLKSKLWQYAYELYIRTHNYTMTKVAKSIECKQFSLFAGVTPDQI
jgi:hypothetical protein